MATAASQGPRLPTAAAGTGWVSPTSVLTANNLRATYNATGQADLRCTGFGFTVASDATITGIVVHHQGQGASATAAQRQVRLGLTKNGTVLIGTRKTGLQYNQNADTDLTSGTAADLWGTTWTPAEINAATFGCLVSDTNATAASLAIDVVDITVHYTLPDWTRRGASGADAPALSTLYNAVMDAGLISPAGPHRDQAEMTAYLGKYDATRLATREGNVVGCWGSVDWTQPGREAIVACVDMPYVDPAAVDGPRSIRQLARALHTQLAAAISPGGVTPTALTLLLPRGAGALRTELLTLGAVVLSSATENGVPVLDEVRGDLAVLDAALTAVGF